MKASLIWPCEQRFVNSAAANEFGREECEVNLWWERRRVTEVRRFTVDFPMHLSWENGRTPAAY